MTPARNPGIDLLRGLSIFLVVAHHVAIRIPLKQSVLLTCLPKWAVDALAHNGYEAVFVFFVISGFLITSKTLLLWGDLGRIPPRAFYLRRASRIVPCLLLLVALLSFLHLAGISRYVISSPKQSLPRAVLAALGLHLNWYEGHTGYLPASWDVLWSLSIEEVFYLAFPIVCLGLGRARLLVPALGLLALSLPFSRAAIVGNPIWQEKAYLPGLAAIAMGVLAALAAKRFEPGERVSRLIGIAGAGGLTAVLLFEKTLWAWMRNGTLLFLTFTTASLVVAFHWSAGNGRRSRIFGTGWLQSMGRLSYEIYLSHMFVVWPVVGAFQRSGMALKWGIVWYVPALFFSWGLGWAIARFFSIPCERAIRGRARQVVVASFNYGAEASA